MTHLEAQTYIMPFIEGNVPENRQKDFVMHMQNCPKCHEELEIYYTLLVGMKQLDNRETLSTDFKKDLEKDLKAMGHKVRSRRNIKVSAFSVITAVILLFCFLGYLELLVRVYLFEQHTKETNQGSYYFSTNLYDKIIYDKTDRVSASEKLKAKDKVTDFKRIRGYNAMEEDYDCMLKVGEDMVHVEVTTD